MLSYLRVTKVTYDSLEFSHNFVGLKITKNITWHSCQTCSTHREMNSSSKLHGVHLDHQSVVQCCANTTMKLHYFILFSSFVNSESDIVVTLTTTDNEVYNTKKELIFRPKNKSPLGWYVAQSQPMVLHCPTRYWLESDLCPSGLFARF